jgi:ketosteroid isomerase-like protein
MSEENVELVRRALQAFDRRDLTSLLAVLDEDCEVVPIRDWPDPAVRGAEAAYHVLVQALDALEPFRTADTEFIDAGVDKVLLQYRTDVTGKGSGATVEFRLWCVVTVRKGRLLRAEWFSDRGEALAAAGLREFY